MFARAFLRHLIETVPYKTHMILTDNSTQFTNRACDENDIEHRMTKPNHLWTNGQLERMNRTIKEATVKRFHYDSHEKLKTPLNDLMAAYNFGRRLKTLSGLTPYGYIAKIWTSEPDRFIVNPFHWMPGLAKRRNVREVLYEFMPPEVGISWRLRLNWQTC